MIRHALNKPAALALALLLAAAAILYASTAARGWRLVKLGTPIRKHLYAFPESLGPWRRVDRVALSHEMADELGAADYILATYESAGRRVTALLAYHTAMPDARPFVSPRCFVAGGIDSSDFPVDRPTLRVRPRAAEPVDLPLNRFATRQAAPDSLAPTQRIYFTHIANGLPLADPRAVADRLFDPTSPKQWYCRIELSLVADDTATADALAVDFLAHALPPIMDHLPPLE